MKTNSQKWKALQLFQDEKITFSKAASLANMNIWDFAALVREKKIVWIKNKESIRKDIEAAL